MKRLVALVLVLAGLCGGLSAQPAAAEPDAPVFHTGVTVYFDVHAEDGREAIGRILDERAAERDTAIAVVIPFDQDRWDASAVTTPDDLTPTMEQVRFFVREANKRGLAVMIKPLMDEANVVATGPHGAWRGTIQPADVGAWFASYTELLLGYAELAREEGVAWIVIGSELSSLEVAPLQGFWWELIDRLRRELDGSDVKLTYGQNWDQVPNAPSWFSALDALSIDAYFPLAGVGDDASVEQLVQAFARHAPAIESLKAQFPEKPLFFTEVGIRSQANSYATPWAWINESGSPLNLEIQRAYFAAACRFYGAAGNGIFWWMVSFDLPEEPEQDRGFSFVGKPAEQEVNKCSAEWTR